MKRYLLPALIVLAAFGLTGCPSNNQVLLPPPGSTPLSKLFVTNDGGSGVLDIFTSPFSAASTPSVAFQVPGSTDVDDVAFDASNNVYVGLFDAARVDVFSSPISPSSTALFSITVASPEGLDVDTSGNLYVASSGHVQIFSAPLSGSSTPSTTITVASPIGVKLDTSGNLYVASESAGVLIFHPPFTNTSTPAVTVPLVGIWGISIDKSTGNLWAVNRSAKTVNEFTPPFSNTSTPALTISSGLTDPAYPALDASGNLYVSDFGAPGIRVYSAPLSAASTVAFTFAAADPNGIRFGP